MQISLPELLIVSTKHQWTPFTLVEALLESLGHIQCFTISDGDIQCKCLIPTVMLYDFHSPELEFINWTEFECLVHVAKKRECCESTKNRQFDLSPLVE